MKKQAQGPVYWYEDSDRNIYNELRDIPEEVLKTKQVYYHSSFPNALVEEISEYRYDANGYSPLGCNYSTYNPKLIVAMVNSGDYTFIEAVQTVVDCCERCLNVLYNKYLNEKNFEKSYLYDNWDRRCKFCEKEDDKYFEGLEQKISEEARYHAYVDASELEPPCKNMGSKAGKKEDE